MLLLYLGLYANWRVKENIYNARQLNLWVIKNAYSFIINWDHSPINVYCGWQPA